MSVSIGYLLDTNILLALIRANPLGQLIDQRYGLRAALNRSVICVVTIGEMLSLVRQFNWGQAKRDELQVLLNEVVCLDINHPDKRSDLDEFVKCYHGGHTATGDPGAPGPGQSNAKRKALDGRSTPTTREKRKATIHADKSPDGRWRCFTYDELEKRDKLNLDIFWLRDKGLEESDDLPEPDVLAQEIADDLQTALDQFAAIAAGLRG